MRFIKKIISTYKTVLWQMLFALSFLTAILFSNSCANPGVGPQGGPRDTIPPVILNSSPKHLQTNFTGNEIVLSFDEYVVADNLATKLVVSPPVAERPTIRMRGRNLIVRFDEDLIPGRTYSVDFRDAIRDFNEGNKIESFRMLFSTYDQIDTLRISGYLLDAFTLEPIENSIATIYTLKHDSLFTSLKPDFIAHADETGFFMFDNLPETEFRLYGLVDSDRKLYYSSNNDLIAFTDTLINPRAEFIEQADTIIAENDTIITNGYTQYSPDLVFPLLFKHKTYSQTLVNHRRESPHYMQMTFREPLTDSCQVSLIGFENDDALYFEFSQKRDSLLVWLTDTLIAKTDSVFLELTYTLTDSIDNFISKTDTLAMVYAPRAGTARTQTTVVPDDSTAIKPQLFDLLSNHKTGVFDLNKQLHIVSSLPVMLADTGNITLAIAVNDSTFEMVGHKIVPINNSKRKFLVDFDIQEDTNYKLTIDSATVKNYYDYYNNPYKLSFKTQKLDQYGSVMFEIEGVDTTLIVQLVKNSKTEDLVREIVLQAGENKAVFDYLKADKYRVKAIIDYNNNGRWDAGNFKTNIQPEPVHYFEKIIAVKANWELKENWLIEPGLIKPKEFIE